MGDGRWGYVTVTEFPPIMGRNLPWPLTPLVKTASVLSKVIQEGTPSTLSVTEIASQSWTDRIPSARKE